MGKKIALITLCVILTLILIVVCVGGIWLINRMNMINRVDPMVQTTMSAEEYELWLESQKDTIDENYTGEIIDGDDIVWEDNSDPIGEGEHIINILLIGQDRRAGEGRQRSDAMILCTINRVDKTITLTSFMRDMYVEIPGYRASRINSSYALGGMQLLDDTLKRNFGVQVDGNIEVDFDGFIEVVDMVGGIDIELNSSEANYLNRRGNWDVDDSTAWQWDLKEGMNHLTGEQALAYSRIRYIGNGDFERTERQRKVLNILFEKCKDLSVLELDKLLQKILPYVTTDMTNKQILEYATMVFPMFSDLKVNTQRIPEDGEFWYAYVDEMSVLRVDFEANKAILAEIMGEKFSDEQEG